VRYLTLSDIHANWEALTAVVEHAHGKYDQILNCGDLVGYGADPNAVVDWCRSHTPQVVRGNHDKACVGLQDLEWFNPAARASAVWTNEELTEDHREYLRLLPKGPKDIAEFQILHGSPADEDEYLITTGDVAAASEFLECGLAFFGHTHIQGAFMIHRNGVKRMDWPILDLENDTRYLVNPGSVGQPRDGDPRAAYAIYDTEARTIRFGRTQYDVPTTQMKILRAGMPEILASRLELGR
jgi:diadenosine tetraphosphatase ApaH/serine/threonine PP2A family protein phosphatase